MCSVHRRREDLEAHAVTMPQPPLWFRMPELSALPGVTLVGADEVAVAGRFDQPVTLSLDSGSRLVVTGANGAGRSTLLAVLEDPRMREVNARRGDDHGVNLRKPRARQAAEDTAGTRTPALGNG